MAKPKRHIMLPLALLLYAVVMSVWGWYHNPDIRPDFWWICSIQLAVIVVLFFLLRYLDRKRDERR